VQFHCRDCRSYQAYRSSARNLFEKYLIPLLLLQTVRCERCMERKYVFRTIPVPERGQVVSDQKEGQAPDGSKPGTRVA